MKRNIPAVTMGAAVFLALVAITGIVFNLSGCGAKPESTKSGTALPPAPSPAPSADSEQGEGVVQKKYLTIVVSNDFMRELVFRFARTRVKEAPYIIIKPGVNPLTYEPTPEDEEKMLAADLVLYNGLGLEPGLEKLIKKINKKVRCEAVTDILKKEDLLPSKEYPGGYDPHYWWDPSLWEKILYRVVRIFEEVDTYAPTGYGYVYVRYGEATSLLNHRSMKVKSSQIPDKNRVLITLHPVFTYFGRLYGFKTLSLYGPGSENYTRTRLEELADYIVAHKVPAIFPEFGYSDTDMKTLQAAVKKRGYDVALAEPLYSYALAPMGERDYTYLMAGDTLMERIFKALKPAPASAMGGRQ